MKQSAAISSYFLVKHMGESSEIFYRMKGGVGDSPVDFFSYEGRTEFSNFFHHTICSYKKNSTKITEIIFGIGHRLRFPYEDVIDLWR